MNCKWPKGEYCPHYKYGRCASTDGCRFQTCSRPEKIVLVLLILLVLFGAIALCRGETNTVPPPIPVSTTQTNLPDGSSPAPTNIIDILSVEFSPVCKNVETNIINGVTNVWHRGHTNRYRLSIQREDLPEFWFTMPVQTSTNLVDWADKDIAIGLPADKAAEFFRPSTNELRTIDKPVRKPVTIVIPTAAEE